MNYKTTFFVALLIAVGDLGKQPFGDAKLVCWTIGGKTVVDNEEACKTIAGKTKHVSMEESTFDKYINEGKRHAGCASGKEVDPGTWLETQTINDIESCFDIIDGSWLNRYKNGTVINGAVGKFLPPMGVLTALTFSLHALMMKILA